MNFKIWLTLLAVASSSLCEEDAKCNFRGLLHGGHCLCNSPYFGANCEIDPHANDEAACKEGPDAAVCSRRGYCISGSCECNRRDTPGEEISGRFCECTNFLCPRFNGLLCSGPDHGRCICDECVCKRGWSGESCECSTANDNCKFPDSGEICSNRGRCECGQCRCEEGFSGPFCQECPICRGSCLELKDCVYCQTFGGRHCPLGYDEYAEKCHLEIEMVDSLGETGEGERKCRFYDEASCTFYFAYSFRESWKIRSSRHRECPPPSIDPESVDEGRYKCSRGQIYTVSSRMATDVTPGRKYTWTFLAYDGKKAAISCPYIEIKENDGCRRDMLAISSPSEHRNAKKLCGDVTEFSYSSNEGIKVSFKTRDILTQFACVVACDGDTLVQQPSPEEPRSASKSRPVVNSCADIDPKFLQDCRCYNCGGHISLHCGLCYKKRIEVFENYDFRVDIELELISVCGIYLDLTGAFGPNAGRIRSHKLCLDSAVRIAYAELENLETLILQDCRKTAFSICQINPLGEPAPSESSTSPSSEAIDTPKPDQFIFTDVNFNVDEGFFDSPNLRKLIISSDVGLTIKPKSFEKLPHLEILSVKSCINVFENDVFKFTSPFLKEVRIEDKCVHSIAPRAITFDSSGRLESSADEGSKIKIHLSLNEKHFDHIPMCPFRPMVEMEFTEVVWESGLQCRSCGGIWYWDLTPAQSSILTSSCYDSVSESTMAVRDYVAHNEKLCSFQTGYLGTCI